MAGGGVAGAAAAIFLGRAGLRVRLFEQHRFPREKACAEGLMPGGVAVLCRLGLLGAVGGAPFEGIRYHGWGTRLEARFPGDGSARFGVGQRRWRLDAILFAAARATPGVSAHEGVRVDGPLVAGGRVEGLMVEGQPVPAALVIAADGPRSLLRRKLALDAPPRGRARLGLRAHFRLPAGARAPSMVEVFIGEGHELYLTPLPEHEVSLAALGDGLPSGRDTRAALARLVAEHPALADRLAGAEQITELAGQMPLESRARRGYAPGLALLGDAAGFVDPITGAGMAQALLSAELLASMVVRRHPGDAVTLDASEEVLRRFDRRRRALLRSSVWLTRSVLALARRPRCARWALRLLERWPGLYRRLVAIAGGAGSRSPESSTGNRQP